VEPIIPIPTVLKPVVVSNESVAALVSVYITKQALGTPKPGSRLTVTAVPTASEV
jgi:hypothetical protein